MKKPFIRRFTKKVFVVINLVIALLFLAGAYAAVFPVEEWWFLSLFTLLLPYLGVILIGFIIFWTLFKPAWSLISLATLLLCLSQIEQIVPFNLPAAFPMQKNPESIRIMSWNVELFNILNYKDHPERRQAMFDLINEYDPDIACFQEVVAGEDPQAINYLPDIINALNFKDYFFSYQVRNNFDRHHHFGILILSKFPILHKQTMVNNPDDYNSVFQYADLLVDTDTLRVYNAHLQSLKFTAENREYLETDMKTKARNIGESKSILSKIRKGLIRRSHQAAFVKDDINHSPHPVIFCGDFNDVPVSFAYKTLGAGLKNAFVQKGWGIGNTYSSIAPTLRIDNIFLDKSFSVESFKRIGIELSDHYPIVCDITTEKAFAQE